MRTIHKIGISALVIILIILGSVKVSMDTLKKEAESSLLSIAKFHANTYNEQITQLFTSLNVVIDSFGTQIQNNKKFSLSSKNILSQNPYIRSLYILDDENKVINSTVNENIGKKIDLEEFYPKPMFGNSILRFGNIHKGRDFFIEDNALSFIPIVKKININSTTYYVLITINNSYFTNKYAGSLKPYYEQLEIIRIDNSLLYTNFETEDQSFTPSALYFEALEKSFSVGIEKINEVQKISAYYLSDIYPLMISVKLDYNENLKEWDYKTFVALFGIGILVFVIAFVIVKLLVKYRHAQQKEIAYQKQQIVNQEKIRNAYIVYQNTNDGILITDANCNVIDVNKAFTTNTGYKLSEVYGKNPRFLKSDIHEESFYDVMWLSIENYNHWHGEIINKKKDGQLYTELLTINKVIDNTGTTKNYIGVFTNITKQKEQEKQIKEQEEFIFHQSKMAAMGEMLENIAHQWRQPLSVISTAATAPIMEQQFGLKNAEDNLDRFKLINESAQYLSKTIDDFRDFFRPDKEKKIFNIHKVVGQALQILDSKFKHRDIKVVSNIEDIDLYGYESELIQVIMNILNNAKDALEHIQEHQHRYIFIDIYKEKNRAIFIIKDSGGGIPENIMSKVFEPYFTTKHKAQGTGIGLYMSEEIITKHMHGTLKVKNVEYEYEENVLFGAEFEINIPLK